jgi:hypothetical protein
MPDDPSMSSLCVFKKVFNFNALTPKGIRFGKLRVNREESLNTGSHGRYRIFGDSDKQGSVKKNGFVQSGKCFGSFPCGRMGSTEGITGYDAGRRPHTG